MIIRFLDCCGVIFDFDFIDWFRLREEEFDGVVEGFSIRRCLRVIWSELGVHECIFSVWRAEEVPFEGDFAPESGGIITAEADVDPSVRSVFPGTDDEQLRLIGIDIEANDGPVVTDEDGFDIFYGFSEFEGFDEVDGCFESPVSDLLPGFDFAVLGFDSEDFERSIFGPLDDGVTVFDSDRFVVDDVVSAIHTRFIVTEFSLRAE